MAKRPIELLDPNVFVLLALVSIVAATVQGAVGFGFGLLAMPGFMWILGSTESVPLVIVLSMVLSGGLAAQLRDHVDWRVTLRFAGGAFLGFPAGLAFSASADTQTLMLSVSVVVLVSAVVLMARPPAQSGSDAIEPRTPATVSFGALAGAMTIALGMPGPPVVLYLSALGISKDRLRGTVLAFFALAYVTALGTRAATLGVPREVFYAAALVIPLALLGGWVGDRLSRLLDEELFRRLALALIGLTGLSALVSAWLG